MTFIGSARKWRPQRFEELIGQEHIRRTLSNALGAGRIATAYLFSGTRGVGKTTTARILAKALNCESAEGPVAEPCNQCASCGEITRGSHPDILEIDGATYTGVDNVRELREGLRYRPARGRYKSVIIDEVHMLSKGAFNALLKTLEEPPPHVVFIFATTELQRVPDTILSRCQVFEFRRIATSVITEHLSRIADDQKRRVDEEALRLIAKMGEGSMRDAQSLLDQVLAFSGEDPVTSRDVEGVLGVPSSEVYRNLVSAIVARDGRAGLCELKDVFDAGHDLRLFCANLLEYLRDCMVLQVAGTDEELFDVGPGEIEERKAIASKLNFSEIHQAYAILQGAEAELRISDHPRMTLELALLRMCQIEPVADLGALIERLESMAPGAPSGPRGGSGVADNPAGASLPRASLPKPSAASSSGKSQASPEAQAPGASVAEARAWEPVEARRVWGAAVESLPPARKTLLQGAELDLETEGVVRVHISRENGHPQGLHMIEEMVPIIEAYFESHAPWPAKVILVKPGEGAEASAPVSAGPSYGSGAVSQKDQAVVQEVVDLFDGKIVDIKRVRRRSGGGEPAAEPGEEPI